MLSRSPPLPLPPNDGIAADRAEAVDGLDHLTLERKAPHLAVRDHFQAGLLLEGDGPVDGAILDDLEIVRRQSTRAQILPRLEQLVNRIGLARQAADAPQDQSELESAYAEVRQAFEAWIQLTAFDTFSAAVGERAAEAAEEE